ncbi:hypothetical protein [Streptomyces sp. NRRL S-15]|uniref:hypothetical protein n=1 Tax=Streptomyces sp. NRRL S-15 TaxID=1463886 RepID=UPI0004CC5EF5|nr:hypothetical protein [Streptomyces sp. NRRL S-15]
MPRTPAVPGSARSADAVNEEIRALWQRSGGVLTPEGQREYERLLVEWAAAVKVDVRAAA